MNPDKPVSVSEQKPAWGSDVIADAITRLDIPYVALNPGSSYRGLHDSFVNYLGNQTPTMTVCLHEEDAIALAHGWAKVTERPMIAAIHSNVGLMHATMAIYNAYVDRVPMIILGATGPVDAVERRPWIDWIHTATDQGALIRNYTKWDDQPASPGAAVEAIFRANFLTRSYPSAPVYICLDAGVQEAPLAAPIEVPHAARFPVPSPPVADPALVAEAARMLSDAKRPLILLGRVSRSTEDWARRVMLAERLGAAVLTDLKTGASFPTDHPLHPASCGTFLTADAKSLVRSADVVLCLDWIDPAGTLRQAYGADSVEATVITCTVDQTLHNGWTKDHFALPQVDLFIPAHPDRLTQALVDELGEGTARPRESWPPARTTTPFSDEALDGMHIRVLARELAASLRDTDHCLIRLPLGWSGEDLHVAHPLDYLGQDGGAGLASGPGMAVGAALALQGTDRVPVAVLGDGDFLMGSNAIWTAARYRIPLLIVIANNRSFFNDEMHQQNVAIRRGRPVENRWIGQHIRNPDPDLSALATSLGLVGLGPVSNKDELSKVLENALGLVRDGACVVVDVHIGTEGYPS
jgi:thiamine pyrophosphate-dependent acetolactate synthase large subunit-like protein